MKTDIVRYRQLGLQSYFVSCRELAGIEAR